MKPEKMFEQLKEKNNYLVNGILKPENYPDHLTASDCSDLALLNLELDAVISDFKNSKCDDKEISEALSALSDIEWKAKSILKTHSKYFPICFEELSKHMGELGCYYTCNPDKAYILTSDGFEIRDRYIEPDDWKWMKRIIKKKIKEVTNSFFVNSQEHAYVCREYWDYLHAIQLPEIKKVAEEHYQEILKGIKAKILASRDSF